MNENFINNFRADLLQLSNFHRELEEYLKSLEKQNNNFGKAFYSVIKQYSDSFLNIVFLLGSNYVNKKQLGNNRIGNIGGTYVNIRKLIEADVIMNILINYDNNVIKEYLQQIDVDTFHISKAFNGSSNFFETVEYDGKRNRYLWLEKALNKKVRSIDDLIDNANLTTKAKKNFKTWVSECNYMSHPNLYSDSKYEEVIDTNIVIKELTSIFLMINDSIYAFIEMIEFIELNNLVSTNYDLKTLRETFPKLMIFFYNYLEQNDKTKEILNKYQDRDFLINDFTYLQYDKLPYLIRADYAIINGSLIMQDYKVIGKRKERTLSKLIDVYADNIRELLLGYFYKIPSLFYSKIRQVLEDISYINLILDMSEEEVEIFQSYTDIKRYINFNDKLVIWSDDEVYDLHKIKNQTVYHDGEYIKIEKAYQKNITFLKNHYKNKFNAQTTTKFIRRPNSWLTNGKTPLTNWDLIQMMLKKLRSEIFENIAYYKGVYCISSLSCHINEFSNSYNVLHNEDFVKEMMKSILVIIKENYYKLYFYVPPEFKIAFKYSDYEFAIEKMLKKINKSDNI